MVEDAALLREYAEAGSESAFAELVRRHLDLVYSTALRGVGGDAHLAKDVSQSVFLDLARKASSLSHRAVLSGWLYTSACYAAAKAVRAERRRQEREQKAQAMQDEPNTPASAPDWERIGPALNSAMLELAEPDREILLLRFFEKQPLAQVGQALGLTENAARMRVERALERLRRRLVRHGVTSTAAVLAVLLANQAVTAAPLGLAACIASASLTGAAASSSSILNLILMTKAKAVVLGTLAAAAIGTPLAVQYQVNARLRGEVAALQSQLAESHASPAPVDSEETERRRREHEELLRLRGEMTVLRQRSVPLSNSPTDAGEFQRMKSNLLAKMAYESVTGQALLGKAPEIPMLPAASWANVGFATPAEAFQTLNWAVAHRDTNAFLNAIGWDPQVRARAEALFARLPDSVRQQYGSVDGVVMDWMLSHATPMSSFRVLSQTEQGPDEISLIEQHQYTDDRVRENALQFHRDESGTWRQVLPEEMMPKLEHVISDLAGARSGAPSATSATK